MEIFSKQILKALGQMQEDRKQELSASAKRRLRRKAQEVKRERARRRKGDDNWHDGAKVAVFTSKDKQIHADAVFRALLKLRSQGIEAQKMLSFNTYYGTLTYVG